MCRRLNMAGYFAHLLFKGESLFLRKYVEKNKLQTQHDSVEKKF